MLLPRWSTDVVDTEFLDFAIKSSHLGASSSGVSIHPDCGSNENLVLMLPNPPIETGIILPGKTPANCGGPRKAILTSVDCCEQLVGKGLG